jgi:hypothetical protein
MGLPKGKTNNPAGRPEGSINKTTKELREMITAFVSDNWETVQEDFQALEPKDRLQFFDRMLQYALPKLSTQTIELTEAPPIKLPPWFLEGDDEKALSRGFEFNEQQNAFIEKI